MTTRNALALGLLLGAFLVIFLGASSAPAPSEHVSFPSNHAAPVHEMAHTPVGELRLTGRSQASHPTSGFYEKSPFGNEPSAGSVQPRTQRTPTVDGQGAASNPPAPTEIVFRLVAWGAGFAALSLLAFGAYSVLRGRVRSYLGRLRNRQLHRRQKRARGRKDEAK